mgnify:CR=1 FL=1
MAKFKALQSAIVPDSKGSNEPIDGPIDRPLEGTLEQKILNCIASNPNMTYDMMVEELLVSRSTVKRSIAKLTQLGHLVRRGSRRYGYWEIID